MLRTSRLHPHMSSFTHMKGLFDYNATPIAPPGIKTIVYETPQQRKTWAQHGVDAWYIGYCPDHYRCHKAYVPATRGERISHTVSFFPHDFAVSSNNHQDDIARSIRDLTTALQHGYLHTPLQHMGDKQFAAIQALENIFYPNIQQQATQAPIHPTREPPEIAPLLQQIQQSTSVDLDPTLQELPGSNADGHRYPTRYSLKKNSYSMACTRKYSYATEQLAKIPAHPIRRG